MESKFLNLIMDYYKEIRLIELSKLYNECASIYSRNNTHMGNILDILRDYQKKEGIDLASNDAKLERSIMRSFFIQKEAGNTALVLDDPKDAMVTIHKRLEDESKALCKYIKSKTLIKTRKEFFDKRRCIDIKEVKKDDKNIKLQIINNDSSKFEISIKISTKGDKTGKATFSIKTTFSNAFCSNGEKVDNPTETKILNMI